MRSILNFPKDIPVDVWNRAEEIEESWMDSYGSGIPDYYDVERTARVIMANQLKEEIERQKAAEAEEKYFKEIEEELQVLEYANLQLANGYGDRMSRDDLAPLRRLINRHKAQIKG